MLSKNLSYSFIADADSSDVRLDVFVTSKIENLTRSRAKQLIESERVTVNGSKAKAAYTVLEGDSVDITVPPPIEASAKAQEIPLDIIYEDSDIIVINKSAGMVVHPAAGHPDGTLVNALLAHCKDLSGVGGELRAGIVHRLDMGTSGVIIAAKNDEAHGSLSEQFKNRAVKKIYCALVFGLLKNETGVIDIPIGRSSSHRKKFSSRTSKGRSAITEWRVLEEFGKVLSWMEVRLRTGRTHQVRVHFAEIGHSLVGDPLYGGDKKIKMLKGTSFEEAVRDFSRPALHALKLGIKHPGTGEGMEFEAPLANDLRGLLNNLRGTDG